MTAIINIVITYIPPWLGIVTGTCNWYWQDGTRNTQGHTVPNAAMNSTETY